MREEKGWANAAPVRIDIAAFLSSSNSSMLRCGAVRCNTWEWGWVYIGKLNLSSQVHNLDPQMKAICLQTAAVWSDTEDQT